LIDSTFVHSGFSVMQLIGFISLFAFYVVDLISLYVCGWGVETESANVGNGPDFEKASKVSVDDDKFMRADTKSNDGSSPKLPHAVN